MLRLLNANRNPKGERGQLLVPFTLLLFVLLAIGGLALDVGMMFATRVQVSRAVDAAALAAVSDLPDTGTAAARATDFLGRNEPNATLLDVSFPVEGQVRVEASKPVKLHFISLLPGVDDSIDVKAHAVAGGGGGPIDIVVVLDDTGTMKQGCNASKSNAGCPIKGERDGGQALLDALGVDPANPDVLVGVMPFRGCYTAENTGGKSTNCIHEDATSALTNDTTGIEAIMGMLTGDGGSGTNVCRGLLLGEQVLNGAGSRPEARKVLILLTDGDNLHNGTFNPASGETEDWYGAAAPSTYNCTLTSDNDSAINAQDVRTGDLADSFAAAGIEIFVIGYGVDGTPNTSACNPTALAAGGSGRHNNNDPLDRNLAKCIATSSAGSNDHYFEALGPEQIPDAFRMIAQRLAQRLVE